MHVAVCMVIVGMVVRVMHLCAVAMRVVIMAMPLRVPVTAVSTTFWFKGFMHSHYCHVHGTQHVGQNVVGLNFQMVGLQLNRYMAVTQVVGGTCQVKR